MSKCLCSHMCSLYVHVEAWGWWWVSPLIAHNLIYWSGVSCWTQNSRFQPRWLSFLLWRSMSPSLSLRGAGIMGRLFLWVLRPTTLNVHARGQQHVLYCLYRPRPAHTGSLFHVSREHYPRLGNLSPWCLVLPVPLHRQHYTAQTFSPKAAGDITEGQLWP